MKLNQVTLPAKDIKVSTEFYLRLGFIQIVDAAHYARFQSTVGDSTFSIHHISDELEVPGVVVYFETERLDDVVARLIEKGVEFLHGPRDEPWLWREARLLDPSGNEICLYWAGDNRLNPPWRVQGGVRTDL